MTDHGGTRDRPTLAALVDGARAGDHRAVARLISLVERGEGDVAGGDLASWRPCSRRTPDGRRSWG